MDYITYPPYEVYNFSKLWVDDINTMFVCFVTGEREEKGKEKGKGKGKRKRKKNSINMFGHRETEKKEM